ncbi:MAG: response regulator transcription factor [Bacteroidota bacterium]
MRTLKIAIADDEALFRKGLRMILSNHRHINILFEAENGADLLRQLKSTHTLPDILLLDLKMPETNGIEVAKAMQASYPDIKIVVLSTYFNQAFVINLLEYGVAAYLPKDSEPNLLIRTIDCVAEKGFHYSDEVLRIIQENMTKKSRPKMQMPFNIKLTSREKEILQLICNEYTTPEIAKMLFLSPRTVNGHRNNLLAKLGCKNTAGLVALAVQQNLVQIDPKQAMG